jgi:hypothetical protein
MQNESRTGLSASGSKHGRRNRTASGLSLPESTPLPEKADVDVSLSPARSLSWPAHVSVKVFRSIVAGNPDRETVRSRRRDPSRLGTSIRASGSSSPNVENVVSIR